MGSSSENSHNSKPSLITYHDDDGGNLMSSFRNLSLNNSQGTSLNNNFGVGSYSFSVSSEQGSKKEGTLYGGQVNGALGKRPVDSCVSEYPIVQDNIWAYHNSINEGAYLPSYLHSRPTTNNTSNDLLERSDDDGLDLLPLPSYLEMTTSANNYPSSSAKFESVDDGLDHLDLEQYGFIETSPEMALEQYGFFEIFPETTTSAANPSSNKVPLNLISSNNTQTESKPDSSPGNSMGSTNYIMCLNKDCYKCLPFTDTSHSGSTRNLRIGSFMLINGGESKEASTSGTESAATCKS